MNVLELLKQDHQKVAGLFEQAEQAASDKQKEKLFEQIKSELETHTRIEETIFYPALKQYDELQGLLLEALEEHKQVKTLLREITALSDGSEKFDAKLKVMKENVEHHVEEEESEMFPKVSSLLSRAELEKLGQALVQAKQQQTRTAKS